METKRPITAEMVIRHLKRSLTLEPRLSPFFFNGLVRLLYAAVDPIPAHTGTYLRWAVLKLMLKKIGRMPHVRSGNVFMNGENTEIGDYFLSYNDNHFGGGPIKIGDNVMVGGQVIFETTHHLFDDPETNIADQGVIREAIVVEDDVMICQRVIILAPVTIGRGSVIGAGSVVTKDIPPYSIAVGVPARVVRKRGEPKKNQGDKG